VIQIGDDRCHEEKRDDGNQNILGVERELEAEDLGRVFVYYRKSGDGRHGEGLDFV
jgi:hypothetical protein